ncbi:MAG: PH domain-containing protein [Armatimonadetes bacterium]|nr:PH domain-containing protein [Armatimonadota bacterium]
MLDDAGITVQRWVGRSQRVPWGDIVGATWQDGGRLVVTTIDGEFVVAAGTERLTELAACIDSELASRHSARGGTVIGGGDVLRWLNGFKKARLGVRQSAADRVLDRGYADFTLLFLGVGLGCGIWYVLTGTTPPGKGEPGYAGLSLLMVATPAGLIASVIGLVHWLWPPVDEACEITANAEHFRVTRGRVRIAAWSEVAAIAERDGCFVVSTVPGAQIVIPKCREFQPVIETIRAVLRHQASFRTAGQPLPDGALSLAEHEPVADVDRGLSQAEEQQVDA